MKLFNVSDPTLQDICMWRPAQMPGTMIPNVLFLLLLVHDPLQIKSKAIFLSSLYLLPSFLFHCFPIPFICPSLFESPCPSYDVFGSPRAQKELDIMCM